jgi:hypothetical protein
MTQLPSSPTRLRRLSLVAPALLLSATIAACGSSAPASNPLPSVALPSIALPSITLPSIDLPSIALPSVEPGASVGTGVDAAAGLTIDPPYSLVAMPPALQQIIETQMASSLGAAGSTVSFGFRQVGGGTGTPILMVMGFPAGSLTADAYQAALGGITANTAATFKTTTVDGVEVSTGTTATGGIAVFHIGDHLLAVLGTTETDGLAIATALIGANQ